MPDVVVLTIRNAATLKLALIEFVGDNLVNIKQIGLRASDDHFSCYLLVEFWDDPRTYKVRQIFETDDNYHQIFITQEKL